MTQRLSSNLDGWPFIEKRKAGRRGGTSKGDEEEAGYEAEELRESSISEAKWGMFQEWKD